MYNGNIKEWPVTTAWSSEKLCPDFGVKVDSEGGNVVVLNGTLELIFPNTTTLIVNIPY
jgi:hypothetical protein